MKKHDHAMRPLSHKNTRSGFEKTIHNVCPSCGKADLTVYFRSGSRNGVGAYCHSCGMTGFFARNDFFELGRITPNLGLQRTRSRLAGG